MIPTIGTRGSAGRVYARGQDGAVGEVANQALNAKLPSINGCQKFWCWLNSLVFSFWGATEEDLKTAFYGDNLVAFEGLLRRGAKVGYEFRKTIEGYQGEKVEATKALLAKYARVGVQLLAEEAAPVFGFLHAAVQSNSYASVCRFLGMNALGEITDAIRLKFRDKIHAKLPDGRTPLDIALGANRVNPDICSLLVKLGAKVNKEHLAVLAEKGCWRLFVELPNRVEDIDIKRIVQNNQDGLVQGLGRLDRNLIEKLFPYIDVFSEDDLVRVCGKINSRDAREQEAWLAIAEGMVPKVRGPLSSKKIADVGLLDVALEQKRWGLVRALLDKGLYDGKVSLLLEDAVRHNRTSDVRDLLNNFSQRTALIGSLIQTAAAKGYGEVLKMLLENNAPIVNTKEGNTPLHLAVMGNHLECAEILLNYYNEQDIPAEMPNLLGKAPADLIQDQAMVTLFKKKGVGVSFKVQAQTAIASLVSSK